MKLYFSKGACSLAIRILVHEMNLPCEFESVDLKTKKTESGSDFLSINPKGGVPTLMLDNRNVLTENAVIHQYLADTHDTQHLLPTVGSMRRYHILECLNFVATDIHKGFSPLFHPKTQQKEELFIPMLLKKFQIVDAQLGENAFLCGDQYTLPDGYLFVMLMWAQRVFKMDFSELTNITRYYTTLQSRPAISQSLKEEGLI